MLRPLALPPILKSSACTNPSAAFLQYRQLDLYYQCMGIVSEEINELCDKELYIRYADNKACRSQCFLHLCSMDGLEVSASTMCDITQCPSCVAPNDMLDNTEEAFPIGGSVTVMESVKTAQEMLLDEHKQVKERHKKEETCNIL